jgi:hypothetical protein
MSTNDLIEGEALLDEGENDASFDGEMGEPGDGVEAGRNAYADSSEDDEEDDDDEEAARAVSPPSLDTSSFSRRLLTGRYDPRFVKDSSWMKTKKSMSCLSAGGRRRDGAGKNARRMKPWMKKIST